MILISRFLNARWAGIFSNIHAGIDILRGKPRLILYFLLVNTLMLLLAATLYYLCIRSLGGDSVTWISTVSVMALTSYSMVISLTPGNLGIREIFMTVPCQYMGIPLALSILAAGLDRAVHLLVVFVLGGISSKMFMKETKH